MGHWLHLWTKVIFNFWECVVDLRGSAISFFLFTKKRLIYKNLINDELHKTKSVSSLVTKRNLPPNFKLNFTKQKSKNSEIKKRKIQKCCFSCSLRKLDWKNVAY